MENNLFKKFMEFGIGSVLTLILGFISSPIITRMISPEENGKFGMFNTVTNLLLVIGMLGLDQAYVRYYYDEEENNRGKLLKSCIKLPLIINLLTGILIIMFYKPISNYIVEQESFSVTLLLVINLLVSIISRFALLEIRMKQKAKLYSLLNIIMKIANLLFVILIFFMYKNNYMTLIIAIVLTNLLITILAVSIENKEWTIKGSRKLNTSSKEIVKYGVPLAFSMAITWIFQSIDRIAIKEFSGYEQVGLYNGAMTIIALLNAVQTTFTTFWTPVAFEKYSSNPDNKEFFQKINRIVTFIMILIAIILIASKDIIVLLLGEKYREAVFIFPYLVFMPIMFTISETTVMGINFKKKPKMHIYIAGISAVVNFMGNLVLVPNLGAKGAAISTGISYVVFFLARTYFSNKYYKNDYQIWKICISTVLMYSLATYSSFNRFNLVVLILTIISILVVTILYFDVVIYIYMIIKDKVRRYSFEKE